MPQCCTVSDIVALQSSPYFPTSGRQRVPHGEAALIAGSWAAGARAVPVTP